MGQHLSLFDIPLVTAHFEQSPKMQVRPWLVKFPHQDIPFCDATPDQSV
jgi:hypothetical protein